MDGINQDRAGALLQPHADDPDYVGDTLLSVEELRDLLIELDEERFDLHVHTVGDLAVRRVLDAVEAAKKFTRGNFYPRVGVPGSDPSARRAAAAPSGARVRGALPSRAQPPGSRNPAHQFEPRSGNTTRCGRVSQEARRCSVLLRASCVSVDRVLAHCADEKSLQCGKSQWIQAGRILRTHRPHSNISMRESRNLSGGAQCR